MPLGGFDRPIHNVLMLDGRVVYEAYNRHNRSEKAGTRWPVASPDSSAPSGPSP
jgi:hypothetical protein